MSMNTGGSGNHLVAGRAGTRAPRVCADLFPPVKPWG